MQHVETIIIGGGPAGSTCAWHLTRSGREALILDKTSFPRPKLCAGWITTKVMQDLAFSQSDYPHSILKLKIHAHIRGLPFAWRGVPTDGDNYSIRRSEFDDWLLQRCETPVIQHQVKSIRVEGDHYVLDERFSCRYLVGAGGTACPVRRLMFPNNRRKFRQVVTLEREFEYPQREEICHLYFLHYGTKSYAWYFPKGDGFVNIGLGGKANYFKNSDKNIHHHFRKFLFDLVDQRLLDTKTAENFQESGHPYYLSSDHGEVKKDKCFLIGDSAGLATVDLGEGIGPAIESAMLAAGEILGTADYSKAAVSQYTSVGLTQRLARRFVAPHPVNPVSA